LEGGPVLSGIFAGAAAPVAGAMRFLSLSHRTSGLFVAFLGAPYMEMGASAPKATRQLTGDPEVAEPLAVVVLR